MRLSGLAEKRRLGYLWNDHPIGEDTNASKTEAYDRFFLTSDQYFLVLPAEEGAGVFDPLRFVYRGG